jgi:hypothetical protein
VTAAQALLWVAYLTGFSLVLQTIEMLLLRSSWSEGGVWSWSLLREEFRGRSVVLRAALDATLGDTGFYAILALRLAAAAGLLLSPHAAFAGIAFVTSYLVSIRWRGAFNGGSDSMTLLTLLALSAALAGPASWTEPCMVYLAAQLCLSYSLAGWVKVRQRGWLDGTELVSVLRLPSYDIPARVRSLAARPRLMATASLLMLALELAFPLSLLGPAACAAFLGLAFVFHLGNFYVFGLNRFVWAWLAAYPALWWCAERVAQRQ